MAHRNVMASPFANGIGAEFEENVDPMQSMANMVDCMLVLACGLMLALVMSHNLDFAPAMEEVVADTDLEQIDQEIEEGKAAFNDAGSGYEELGVVYRDPETGKMYMLKQDME